MKDLRALPLFRCASLLYIFLVIDDLPLAVSTCLSCMQGDGSLRFMRFDGLQVESQEQKFIQLCV